MIKINDSCTDVFCSACHLLWQAGTRNHRENKNETIECCKIEQSHFM